MELKLKKILFCLILFTAAQVFAEILPPNGVLSKGQSISSDDGKYKLIMQTDGNVVLYRSDGTVRFATYKYGGWLSMQSDGNLVEYSSNNQALWYTKTNGNPGAYLNVQNDGNLVVYSSNNVAKWNIGRDPNLQSNDPIRVGDVVGRDLSYGKCQASCRLK